MADDTLILSNLLCFLSSKYGKCTIKVMKSALIDFYSDKDISAAKTRLLNDLRSMILPRKLHICRCEVKAIIDSHER